MAQPSSRSVVFTAAVARYRLLLEALLAETPDAHEDRGDLVTALALVSAAAGHNNSAIGGGESAHVGLAKRLGLEHRAVSGPAGDAKQSFAAPVDAVRAALDAA